MKSTFPHIMQILAIIARFVYDLLFALTLATPAHWDIFVSPRTRYFFLHLSLRVVGPENSNFSERQFSPPLQHHLYPKWPPKERRLLQPRWLTSPRPLLPRTPWSMPPPRTLALARLSSPRETCPDSSSGPSTSGCRDRRRSCP